MKKLIAVVFIIIPTISFADTSVSGYVRRDGTYVQPHYRSNANSIRFDNYSSQGNSNPYTGQRGYSRSEISSPSIYSQPHNYQQLGNNYNYGNR
jgi:hypothetical protein